MVSRDAGIDMDMIGESGKTGNGDKSAGILRAAWKRMCQYGFAKTTVAEIASEAGIGKGTVYLYFDSKEDILLALVAETNRRVLKNMEDIASSRLSPAKKLEKMFLSRALQIYDVVSANPHGEEVIASHKPAIVESLDWFFKRQKRLYQQVIREGVLAGEFAEKSPAAAAEVLGVLSELLTPPYYRLKKRSEVETFARNLLARFVGGIAGDGKRSGGKRKQLSP